MFFRQKKIKETENNELTIPSEKPRKKRIFLQHILYWLTVISIWCVLTLTGAISYYALTLPDPVIAGLDKRPPNVKILSDNNKIIANRGMRRDHIRLEHLPKNLINAVLSMEDRRFYNHIGIDPYGMIRAGIINYKSGQVVQGGSTITQQLAKNLFLSSQKTFARKGKEILAALWLELHLTKKQILELYLNRVYFGAGAYGIEAAAYQYFEKTAKQLTLAESALLAGLLKAPSKYSPTRNPIISKKRARLVIRRMRELGKISKLQARNAIFHPAKIRRVKDDNDYSYVADWVIESIPGFLGDNEKDLIVETTINQNIQKITQKAIRKIMRAKAKTKNARQASAVIYDSKGAIKALSGGRSHKISPFNRAVKALRQPGSAFKPFIFLAALETGLSRKSIVLDEPIDIGGWRPRNYKGYYRGPITLEQALSKSVNTAAVRLFLKAGRSRVVQTARRLGISTNIHHKPSLALGTAEVTLLELTAAYVPFSNGGKGILPYIIKSIKDLNGNILYQRIGHGPGRVISHKHVKEMNRMMSSVIVNGTGKRANFPGQVIAGKTGTSQNFRDAWFLGYTPYYTMGVWVGNDDNSNMKSVTGGSVPARIWNYVMKRIHSPLPSRNLPGVRRRS